MNDNTKQIQERVLARITHGEVAMHSRAYFALRVASAALLSLVTLVLSVFVLSFVMFGVHESGEQFLLGYGLRGLTTFISLFPWFLFVIDIAFILLLEWSLQGFKVGYRLSLMTLFLAVFAGSAVLAFLLALTPLHPALLDRADRGELPIVGDLYERLIRTPHEGEGIFRGTVQSVRDGHIVVDCSDGDRDTDEGLRTIVLPQGAPAFSVGERVYVFGTSTGQTVEAYGISRFAPAQ